MFAAFTMYIVYVHSLLAADDLDYHTLTCPDTRLYGVSWNNDLQ